MHAAEEEKTTGPKPVKNFISFSSLLQCVHPLQNLAEKNSVLKTYKKLKGRNTGFL